MHQFAKAFKKRKTDLTHILIFVLLAVIIRALPPLKINFFPYEIGFVNFVFFVCVNVLNTKKSLFALIIYFILIKLVLHFSAETLPNYSVENGESLPINGSFGYLLGLIPFAIIVGFLSRKTEEYTFFNLFIFNLIGLIFIFTVGVAWALSFSFSSVDLILADNSARFVAWFIEIIAAAYVSVLVKPLFKN